MSTIKYYQYCSVPLCINNINRTPDKLFIPVPHDPDRRKKWMKLARRDWKKQSIKSMIYFCEDHFDLPNDMENYMQYRIQGYIKKIRMKAGCLPSRFACQLDRKGTAPCADRNVIVKRKRQTLVEEALKEAANEEMPKCTEVKGNPGICRCCMSEGCYKDLGSEYSWMGDTEVYADMLLDCFDISITQHNEGPNGPNRLICEVCITRLRDACNFKKQVMDSEKKFIDMIGRGQFKPQVMVHQKVMKVELDDDGIDDTVEYLEEDMEFTDADDEPLKRPSPQPSASTLQLKAKRGRPRKSALTKHETKKEDKPKASKAVVKDEYPVAPFGGCNSVKRLNNLEILFNHTTVMPFNWRGKHICFFCSETYGDYIEFKKHTKTHVPCSTKDDALRMMKSTCMEIKIDVSDLTCNICGEAFFALDEVFDHLVGDHFMEYDKTVEMPYQEYRLSDCVCIYCSKEFSYFGYLVNHVNIEHPKNCFVCDDCGLRFNKKNDLALHIRSNHQKEGYPCNRCLVRFDSYKSLKWHKDNVHCLQCRNCDIKLPSLSLLQKHIELEHPNTKDFKCRFCSKVLGTSHGLTQHLIRCRMKIFGKGIKPEHCNSEKKQYIYQLQINIQCVLNLSTAVPFKYFAKFSCFYCSKKFVDFDELKMHTMSEHPVCDIAEIYMKRCRGDKTIVKIDVSELACKICRLSMPDLDSFVDHAIAEHDANYDKSIKNCLFPYRIMKDNIPCPLCPDQNFRYFGILQRHINSEHNNNNKICDVCGRSFRTVGRLNLHHAYTHNGFCECITCGLKFKNQWCLSRHNARVHNVKKHKCPKCPEMFQSQYHIQKHLIKVHDIGHRCPHCDKVFTRNSFMKDHVRRMHLKEKMVPCSVCDEKFFDKNGLRSHMVKHKGERNYACDVCGKAFLRRTNLHVHMEMHKKYGQV